MQLIIFVKYYISDISYTNMYAMSHSKQFPPWIIHHGAESAWQKLHTQPISQALYKLWIKQEIPLDKISQHSPNNVSHQ